MKAKAICNYTSPYGGTEYELTFHKRSYAQNKNLAIQVYGTEKGSDFTEPFCSLTVNLGEKLPEDTAYLDTNNCPQEIIFWLINMRFVEVLSERQQGFCIYPKVQFTKEWLEEYLA